jgi:F-type H+-transporting ATPase subunit alpha
LGERIVEVLKQNKNEPLRVGCQVAIVYAVINGFLDSVPVKGVKEYERRLYEKLEQSHVDLLERFEAGYYEQEDVDALRTILHDMNG